MSETQVMTEDELREKYGDAGEHPTYPKSDWGYEVENGDTRRGYWEWVAASIERDVNDMTDSDAEPPRHPWNEDLTMPAATNTFTIYEVGGKVVEQGIVSLRVTKEKLDALEPRGSGKWLYYAAEDGGNRDLVLSFQAGTSILKNGANLVSREQFLPRLEEAIRWANKERGEYGADWMLRNLPAYISLAYGFSAALAKQGVEEWMAGKLPLDHDPEFAKQTLSALIGLGWKPAYSDTASIEILGGVTGGVVNPKGVRRVFAKFQYGRMFVTHGDNRLVELPLDKAVSAADNAARLHAAVDSLNTDRYQACDDTAAEYIGGPTMKG